MSEKKAIMGPGVPQSTLPFSPGIQTEQFVFISGQASVDDRGNIINGTFEEECHRSFDNLGKILAHAGLSFEDVVQVRNYVGDQADLAKFNEIYKTYFKAPFPARTTLIGCLGDLLKFEVDAVALTKKQKT